MKLMWIRNPALKKPKLNVVFTGVIELVGWRYSQSSLFFDQALPTFDPPTFSLVHCRALR
jgi:hypothetical protein